MQWIPLNGQTKRKPLQHTPRYRAIGIAGDVKYENLRREIHPMVYVPITGGGAHFELRTSTNPIALIPAVRKIVSDTDSNLPIF